MSFLISNMSVLRTFVFFSSISLVYSQVGDIWLCHFVKPDGTEYSHYCDGTKCCDNKCCDNPTGISATTGMLIGTGIFVFLLMTGVICGAFCTRNRRQQDRTQLLPAQISHSTLDMQLPDHLQFDNAGYTRTCELQNYCDRSADDILRGSSLAVSHLEEQTA